MGKTKKKVIDPVTKFLLQFDISTMINASKKMNRHFIIHCGPTNSGKTYHAIQALKCAKSGLYLGPLRLLALEMYDTLNENGCPCTLLTGEEIIKTKNAKIIASTIEMCNYNAEYETCVIDEAQLIQDKDRGGNWTKAILLVNAKTIHICTAPEALDVLCDLIIKTGSDYEIISHERLTPLVFSGLMTSLRNVQRGDALITFSRKGVLSVAASLEKIGIKSSVIYGALPPASRREEVRRFSSGETSVVIATDAIGLGVSLPIKRIIFCTTTKYDGNETRYLNVSEIKQISGRAGRYGKYDVGEVLTFRDAQLIESALERETPAIKNIVLPFPEDAIYSQYSLPVLFKTWNSLPKLRNVSRVDMTEPHTLYNFLPSLPPDVDKKEIYSYVSCPVDTKSEPLMTYWSSCCEAIINNTLLPEPAFTTDTLEGCELMYRALDIKHQMLRRIGIEEDCMPEKEALCEKINSFLSKSKSGFLRRCSICDVPLPFNYAYGMCENCHENRRWNPSF